MDQLQALLAGLGSGDGVHIKCIRNRRGLVRLALRCSSGTLAKTVYLPKSGELLTNLETGAADLQDWRSSLDSK